MSFTITIQVTLWSKDSIDIISSRDSVTCDVFFAGNIQRWWRERMVMNVKSTDRPVTIGDGYKQSWVMRLWVPCRSGYWHFMITLHPSVLIILSMPKWKLIKKLYCRECHFKLMNFGGRDRLIPATRTFINTSWKPSLFMHYITAINDTSRTTIMKNRMKLPKARKPIDLKLPSKKNIIKCVRCSDWGFNNTDYGYR